MMKEQTTTHMSFKTPRVKTMSPDEFDDIQVSTVTIIAQTNLCIDMNELFDAVPIASLTVPETLRSKNDIKEYILDQHLSNGTLISIEYSDRLRGFKIKKRKKKQTTTNLPQMTDQELIEYAKAHGWISETTNQEYVYISEQIIYGRDDILIKLREQSIETEKRKYFRNAVTLVMFINGKLINFKVPKQGKIQFTGCTDDMQAILCIQHLWTYLSTYCKRFSVNGEQVHVILRTVMTDIVFHFGFEINRERLDHFINTNTEFNSLLETSFGYTGVNIKIPFQHENTMLKTMTLGEDGQWEYGHIAYRDYFSSLPISEYTKEMNKKRNNTFLVFYSGTAIMSGMEPYYMRDVYKRFVNLIQNARHQIEETIQI